MKTNRLIKSLSALSLIVALALPVAANAAPIVEVNPAPNRNHITSPARQAYYDMKERQQEQLGLAGLRHKSAAQKAASQRTRSTYAEFKDRQMERIMNGD
jgi:hypothetical protein